MNRYLKHFVEVFGINIVAAFVAGAVLLQGDLQSCSGPGGCVIRWQVIGAGTLSALISGCVATFTKATKQNDSRLASLETATGTTTAPVGTAVTTGPAPAAILPEVSNDPAHPYPPASAPEKA